jgi:hypothetical protein
VAQKRCASIPLLTIHHHGTYLVVLISHVYLKGTRLPHAIEHFVPFLIYYVAMVPAEFHVHVLTPNVQKKIPQFYRVAIADSSSFIMLLCLTKLFIV